MNLMIYLLLMLSLILCCVAATQAQTNLPAAVTAPGSPLMPPNPVDTFRKVLAMAPAERERFLLALTPEKRQIVMLKLDEYQGLSAEQREERLRALQARALIRYLIRLPMSNRVERVASLQGMDRKVVEERLALWDQLAPELQKEVLTNEFAIRYIARSRVYNPALPPFPGVDPKIQEQVSHWANLSKADRTEVLKNFQMFLEDLSEKERAQVMAERQDMKSLGSVASLTKEQRERYIAGFKRFAALTPEERQRFLMNAAYWLNMTPEQRETWRVLAKKLSSNSRPPSAAVGRPVAAITTATAHVALDLPSQ